MSARYQWQSDPSLIINEFPAGGAPIDQLVAQYVEMSRKTHAPSSFQELALTSEEQAEVVNLCAAAARRRATSVTVSGRRLTMTFPSANGGEYQVTREARAFRLGGTTASSSPSPVMQPKVMPLANVMHVRGGDCFCTESRLGRPCPQCGGRRHSQGTAQGMVYECERCGA